MGFAERFGTVPEISPERFGTVPDTSKTSELFRTIWNGSGTVPDSKPIDPRTVRNGSGDFHIIAYFDYIITYFDYVRKDSTEQFSRQVRF